jgi:predicted PurR-regulated permease PerM
MTTPRNQAAAWQGIAPTLATFAAVVLAIGCLYWARPVLIPLAVATLLTFMLGPAATWLQRRGLPRIPSVLSVVTVAGLVLAAALWLVGSQLVQLLAELPSYQENVAKRVAEVREQGSGTLLRNVQRFVKEVAAAATGPMPANAQTRTSREGEAPTEPTRARSTSDGRGSSTTPESPEPVTVRVVERAAITSIASIVHGIQPVAEPILTSGLIIVLVVYLLIFREDLRSRIVAVVGRGHLTLTTKALDDAGRRISRYLIAQFTLNAAFGIVIGFGLLAIGVPHAFLWGFTAGMLRYIPYLGAWIACSLPIGMSLLISEHWGQPLAVIGLFIVVEFIANLVVEPWLYGQSIGVSQAAWMIAIIFWTWLWGAVGLMLATPLTTCLVVLGRHVPALKFFDILLGDEPVLTPDVNVYQRLVSRDEDDASEIIRQQSLKLSPVELCDRVLVPALVHAQRDLHAGLLSHGEFEYVLATLHSLAEHQDLAALIEKDRGPRAAEPHALSILACPARDGAEITALTLFQQLLDPQKFQLEIVSAKYLVSEVLEHVAQQQPAIVLIAALPAGGLAHTRHLCKRLRSRFHDQKIAIARWGASAPLENPDQWSACAADYVGTSFEETVSHLHELAQYLTPAHR